LLAVTLVVGCALCANSSHAAGAVKAVDYRNLKVTSGKIEQTKSGLFSIKHNTVRATEIRHPGGYARHAKLRFSFKGRSDKTRKLASGSIKRQIGLKLRAKNACNLVYVMWSFLPTERITVHTKRNPGKSKSKQCGNNGYKLLKKYDVPASKSALDGRTARLQADFVTKGSTYYVDVYVDNKRVISVPIDASFGSNVVGAAGLRSDNGKYLFRFWSGR